MIQTRFLKRWLTNSEKKTSHFSGKSSFLNSETVMSEVIKKVNRRTWWRKYLTSDGVWHGQGRMPDEVKVWQSQQLTKAREVSPTRKKRVRRQDAVIDETVKESPVFYQQRCFPIPPNLSAGGEDGSPMLLPLPNLFEYGSILDSDVSTKDLQTGGCRVVNQPLHKSRLGEGMPSGSTIRHDLSAGVRLEDVCPQRLNELEGHHWHDYW